MSSAETDAGKSSMPFLILTATDRNNVSTKSNDSTNSTKQVIKLKEGDFKLSLAVDYRRVLPAEGHKLNHSEQKGTCNNPMLSRVFDIEKKAYVKTFFTSAGDQNSGAWRSATEKNQFSLGDWLLGSGKYEFKVIGPINFKYLDQKGNALGFEEMQLDLSFWFEIEANSKPSSPRANPVESSDPAYLTEDELKKMAFKDTRPTALFYPLQ